MVFIAAMALLIQCLGFSLVVGFVLAGVVRLVSAPFSWRPDLLRWFKNTAMVGVILGFILAAVLVVSALVEAASVNVDGAWWQIVLYMALFPVACMILSVCCVSMLNLVNYPEHKEAFRKKIDAI